MISKSFRADWLYFTGFWWVEKEPSSKSHNFYHLSTSRAGTSFRKISLSRRLFQGGARHESQFAWGSRAGKISMKVILRSWKYKVDKRSSIRGNLWPFRSKLNLFPSLLLEHQKRDENWVESPKKQSSKLTGSLQALLISAIIEYRFAPGIFNFRQIDF